MARVKTFVNGGSLLPSDLNSIEDDYEFAFSTYTPLGGAATRLDAAAAGTYLLVDGTTGTGVAPSAANAGLALHWLDPARYNANTRTTQLHITGLAAGNGTASTVNFTIGLYAVTAVAGGVAASTVTLAGSPITGSTVALNTPAANLITTAVSGDFAFPAAGAYALAVAVSGPMAANSAVLVRARLQFRAI